MNKTFLSLVALLLLLPFRVSSESFAATYQIGPGDRIQISVYGEPDLSFNELLINSSGTFDYPYLGEITAKGKTAQQLKLAIEKGLKGDYLITPKVMVNFISFREIYVNGEVKKPGGYEYQPGLTVDKAIALAGGFTDRAARKKINITPNGGEETQKGVSLSKAVNPGDIIVIEQSFF
ncbi:polysaccharide export protein [Vibrio sp. S9_S30]|uniref:polysaccharide biosynthesis/export family protein n=1 Tax=Vibrio sp. S9_S30 TaxID=2720226 RepID=UPI0016805AC0|nr:polysaccharide biosynthesis/export family protein [Vibrio sp. S9_S30]MBD1556215.1 polysaccharide export protein [Vibrio sp. S9_S30]